MFALNLCKHFVASRFSGSVSPGRLSRRNSQGSVCLSRKEHAQGSGTSASTLNPKPETLNPTP